MDKPFNADSYGSGVNPEESEEDAVSIPLSKLMEVSGREFKSDEDFLQHYDSLKNFVGAAGQLKDKAKKYDEIVSKKSKDTESYDRMEKLEFGFKHPEAKDILDDVHAYAKGKGITLDEAFISPIFKSHIEKAKEADTPANPGYVASNRLPAQAKMSKAEFKKLPLDKQREIVENFGFFTN